MKVASVRKYVGIVVLLSMMLSFQNCGSFSTALKGSVTKQSLSNIRAASARSSAYKIADATDAGIGFFYAPSTILAEGQYFTYMCSSGTVGAISDWDWIRIMSSRDLVHYTNPAVVMKPNNPVTERSNCDPSVVKASDGYYYMFYSGNHRDTQTLIFVARSLSPSGPFEKWTGGSQWSINPTNTRAIINPQRFVSDAENNVARGYGAGQSTVVYKDGEFKMWYTDDTVGYPNAGERIYLRTSRDATTWSDPHATNVIHVDSVEVKYDSPSGLYVMFVIAPQFRDNSAMFVRYSKDGLMWSAPDEVCPAGTCLGLIGNNPGVAGDEHGFLLSRNITAQYGAAWDLIACGPHDVPCMAKWDLYSSQFSIQSSVEGYLASTAPSTAPTPVATPTPTPVINLVLIHRLYNASTGDHLYSVNAEEGVSGGYRHEGAVFSLSTDAGDNFAPIYRCNFAGSVSHFLSPDSECEGQNKESLLGYVSTYRRPGTFALQRYYNSVSGRHFFTTNAAETLEARFWESVMGYAW